MHIPLCEEGSGIFDNLPTLESSVPLETKKSLVYIVGYITRKGSKLSGNQLLEETIKKYGKCIDSLDRGGLNIPSDYCCQ